MCTYHACAWCSNDLPRMRVFVEELCQACSRGYTLQKSCIQLLPALCRLVDCCAQKQCKQWTSEQFLLLQRSIDAIVRALLCWCSCHNIVFVDGMHCEDGFLTLSASAGLWALLRDSRVNLHRHQAHKTSYTSLAMHKSRVHGELQYTHREVEGQLHDEAGLCCMPYIALSVSYSVSQFSRCVMIVLHC